MMRRGSFLIYALVAAFCFSEAGFLAIATPPPEINIQGTLEEPNGEPVTGARDYRVRFFESETGGSAIGEVTGTVSLSDAGRFSIDVVPPSAALDAAEAWYELAIDGAADGIDPDDIFPNRVRILSVPFALASRNSASLGGKEAHLYPTLEQMEMAVSERAPMDHGHPDYWSVTGNVVSPTEVMFLGTLNDRELQLRTGGQAALRLIPSVSCPNLVGGHEDNYILPGVQGSTIGGGGRSGFGNQVNDDYGTIGGGFGNWIEGFGSTISGGLDGRAGRFATVGGGEDNAALGLSSTIGGGFLNSASGDLSAIVGGISNRAYGAYSVVAGGLENWATQPHSVVGGGNVNISSASGAVVGGGDHNSAAGKCSTVPGGFGNAAQGGHSLAAGRRAKANHDGCFVWADSTDADFASSAADEFSVRANGGARILGGNHDRPLLTVNNLQSGPGGYFTSMNGHSLLTDKPSLIQGPNPMQVALLRWYPANRTGQRFAVGNQPGAVAFDGEKLWVANYGSSTVSVLQPGNGNTVSTYSVGANPSALAYDGANMWVVAKSLNSVQVRSAMDGSLQWTAGAGTSPSGIAFDGTRMWITSYLDNAVNMIGATTGYGAIIDPVTGTIPVETGPWGIAYDGQSVWVACDSAGTVDVFSATPFLTGYTSIDVGSNPLELAFDGARMWVTNSGDDTVSVIRASDRQVIKTLTSADGIGNKPSDIAFDGVNMWITNEDGDTVSIIRASDFSLIAVERTGDRPLGLAFDGVNMWVTDNLDNTVRKM